MKKNLRNNIFKKFQTSKINSKKLESFKGGIDANPTISILVSGVKEDNVAVANPTISI